MSKKTQKRELPADMWLHVASDALARWAASGARMTAVTVMDDAGASTLMISLEGIAADDPRLSPAFVALKDAEPGEETAPREE